MRIVNANEMSPSVRTGSYLWIGLSGRSAFRSSRRLSGLAVYRPDWPPIWRDCPVVPPCMLAPPLMPLGCMLAPPRPVVSFPRMDAPWTLLRGRATDVERTLVPRVPPANVRSLTSARADLTAPRERMPSR